MTRLLTIALATLLLLAGIASANEWDVGLTAGSESINANIHHQTYLYNGYLRIGGSGVYMDDDPEKYKWASLDFAAGSDLLAPGLKMDVGLRGLVGSAEDLSHSGDLGAVAFAGGADYYFSPRIMPVPLELFSRLTWAPSPLCFMDGDQFLEFTAGAGIRVVSMASIRLSYTAHRLDFDSGPGSWDLKDEAFRIGIVMRF